MTYQYNPDVIIGIAGDVWFNSAKHLILTTTPIIILGERRGVFRRIVNLPPIRNVVGLMNDSLVVLARNNRVIRLSWLTHRSYITEGIVDMFQYTEDYVIYLTTNGQLRSAHYLDLNQYQIRGSEVTSIHPLVLSSNYLNGLLIRFQTQESVMLLEADFPTIHSYSGDHRLGDVIKVNMDCIVTKTSIVTISYDNGRFSTQKTLMTDINDAKAIRGMMFLITNNRLTDISGRTLVNNVVRFVQFTDIEDYIIVSGTDQKTYIMYGDDIDDLGIPVVLR